MATTTYSKTADITLISVFCALWASLSLTLGPLGFRLFGLPVLCDFAAFFSLLLVTWVIGKFGASSLTGIIGSLIVFAFDPRLNIIGFAVSALVFDVLMLASRHKLHTKPYNMAIASFATATSAYVAGAIIGTFFMGRTLTGPTLQWALSFWGGWHLVGGIITIVITLPVIIALEKANVRKIKLG